MVRERLGHRASWRLGRCVEWRGAHLGSPRPSGAAATRSFSSERLRHEPIEPGGKPLLGGQKLAPGVAFSPREERGYGADRELFGMDATDIVPGNRQRDREARASPRGVR